MEFRSLRHGLRRAMTTAMTKMQIDQVLKTAMLSALLLAGACGRPAGSELPDATPATDGRTCDGLDIEPTDGCTVLAVAECTVLANCGWVDSCGMAACVNLWRGYCAADGPLSLDAATACAVGLVGFDCATDALPATCVRQ